MTRMFLRAAWRATYVAAAFGALVIGLIIVFALIFGVGGRSESTVVMAVAKLGATVVVGFWGLIFAVEIGSRLARR